MEVKGRARNQIRTIAIPLSAAVALVLGTALVSAAATIWKFPPAGDSYQSDYFSGNWALGCDYYPDAWSHSAVTHVFDGGSLSGIYIYYYDVYSGSTSGSAEWFQQHVVEQHSSHFQVATAPPVSFTGDRTKWWNTTFHYALSGAQVYVQTSFLGYQDSSGCSTRSTMVFGH